MELQLTWPAQHNVKVQTVDTDRRIVLDTQINVFLDTETKVAGGGEVVTSQLVFAHFEATFQDLLGLGTTHCAMDSDFLITPDTERTHSVTSLREHWLLTSQLFQHLEWK